jgi:hypothetical protein
VATLYYALFEGLWGAAAGKGLCRLRVVGQDRNSPGFARALFRALVYVVPPLVPYWAAFGANPKAYMSASQLTQMLLGLSIYGVIALLFVTARRRNGFASVQDLLTRTRVVSRAAGSSRPVLAASDAPPPSVESAITIGPYHVLQALTESAGEKWFLAYDLKLLRKVWIRAVSPGTEPVPVRWRTLGRVGRLRWLTGKRSPEENWDAFEALTGRPLPELIGNPQPWREVCYWLHDLAEEISAAKKDGTLPELALDRVWITGDGRAKLLDFPAPGAGAKPEVRTPKEESKLPPPVQTAQGFLAEVAAAALEGTGAASGKAPGDVAVPLPLHARAFLKGLSQMAGVEAVAAALKPLLSRVAVVSRLRRAALVGGCIVFPVVACGGGYFALTFLQELTRKNPGLMELNSLLSLRTSARFWGGKNMQMPADRQIAIYIAHHYRGMITNQASWSSPYVLSMVKGEGRKFAEQSVAEHAEPTEAEIKEADDAVGRFVPKQQFFSAKAPSWLPAMVLVGALLFYVGVPALIATLLFRGGLVLLIAGVTFVRKDGQRASRLRLLWRAIVTGSPLFLAFVLSIVAISQHLNWGPWLTLGIPGLLAVFSVALPQRGLQDRLAGTWPVPR